MPLILGTNSIKDTGYNVANSCRFDDGSSTQMNKTISSTSTTWTFSCWIKQNPTNTNKYLVSWDMGSGESLGIGIEKTSSSTQLFIYTSSTGQAPKLYDGKLRDPSAWMNIVIKNSSGTITSYINGTQAKTSITGTALASGTLRIGCFTGSNFFYDGYMSEVVLIDGTAYSADSFGEFDEDSGIWKPIDVSGLTFGSDGFYLDFEDSSNLGNDVSGNDNDFTVNNLTAIDQSTDTCTLNMTTWNPLATFNNTLTFSEGNLKGIANSSSNPWFSARATIGFTSGKWFWETKFTGSTDPVPAYIGVVDESAALNIDNAHNANGNTLYYNGSGGEMRVDGSATSNDYGNFSTSDVCGVAVNADDNLITIYKNGSAIITNYALSTTRTGFLFPTAAATNTSSGTNNNGLITNFGSPPYSESGGNSDGNGYGNFSMAVPSGYFCLNSKNLAEYG